MNDNLVLLSSHSMISPSSNIMNHSNSNITSIASRIQEKANQLIEERSTLQTLQQDLSIKTKNVQKQSNLNFKLRQGLLSTLLTRHSMELESMSQQKSIQDLQNKLEQTHDTTLTQLQHQLQVLKNQYDSHTQIYAMHTIQQQIYQRRISQILVRKQKKRQRREKRLKRLILSQQTHDRKCQEFHRQIEVLKQEIVDMDDVEAKDDDEIASLALQIRATIAKRVSLRSAVQDAKSRNVDANQKLQRWEEEYIQT